MIDIKVGDYVETVDGTVGSITYISSILEKYIYLKMNCHFQTEWRYTEKNLEDAIKNGEFKRIGLHDFTKKDEIEPLTITKEYYDAYSLDGAEILKDALVCEHYPSNEDVMNKINEIIEYINKEDK